MAHAACQTPGCCGRQHPGVARAGGLRVHPSNIRASAAAARSNELQLGLQPEWWTERGGQRLMVISQQGIERVTDGLWTHLGKMVLKSVVLPTASVDTNALVPQAAQQLVGSF